MSYTHVMTSRTEYLFIGLLLALTFLLYLPIRHAGFVYDDRWYVTQNDGIRRLDVPGLFADPHRGAAPESGLAQDAYRPLVTLSLALDYHLWGLSPAGYHWENLFLHLLNAFLVWLLFRRLFSESAAALLATAVFLWHPAQVSSVAYISQRTSLLGSLGILLTLLMLGPPAPWSWTRIVCGWLAFGAALFCRETTGGAILVLALLDGLYPSERDRRWISRYVGILFLTALYILIRSHLLPTWSELGSVRHWRSDAAIGLMAFSVYLGKLLVPIFLRVHYAFPKPDNALIGGAAGVLFIYGACTTWALFRLPRLGAALAWIFIFLIPVLQIIPYNGFVSERYLYVSIVGYAWILGMMYQRFPRFRAVLGALLVLFVTVSYGQIPTWQSDQTLWAECVSQDPHDAFAWSAYGESVQDPVEAEKAYHRALAENPTETIRATCLTNLSWLALQKKQFREAEDWARQSIQISPDDKNALYDLMRAYEGQGDRTSAAEIRRRLQQLTPEPIPA